MMKMKMNALNLHRKYCKEKAPLPMPMGKSRRVVKIKVEYAGATLIPEYCKFYYSTVYVFVVSK